MIEKWKDVSGYEGYYQVSTFGRVRAMGHKYQRKGIYILALHENNGYGYLLADLHKDNKYKSVAVHRLVAETFIPNPEKLAEVNHIDGNKKNNNVSNLEWTTHSQNMKHSQFVLGFNIPKKVLQIKNNKIIAVFNSAKEAEKETGICHIQIRRCCKNRKYYNTAGGYEWQYGNIHETKGGDNEQ